MMVSLLKNPFVGVHELRKNLTRLLESIKEEGTEVIVTQQGKPVALLMNIEKYLELKQAVEEFSDPQYVADLLEAKREIKEGRGIPADEVFAKKGI